MQAVAIQQRPVKLHKDCSKHEASRVYRGDAPVDGCKINSPHDVVPYNLYAQNMHDKFVCNGAFVIPQFFQSLEHCEEGQKRVGEAQNPGPLCIRTFNPTQLLNHEQEVSKWPHGIYTACETSHTQHAKAVIAKRFRSKKMNVIMSHEVPKHTNNGGAYRGKASGTAVMSQFPMHPHPLPIDVPNISFL